MSDRNADIEEEKKKKNKEKELKIEDGKLNDKSEKSNDEDDKIKEREVIEEEDDDDDVECPPCHFIHDYQLPPLKTRQGRKVKVYPCVREPHVSKETLEQTALRRLRSRLKPLIGNPSYRSAVCQGDSELLAWLRAFDLNVYMTEARLKKTCKVRQDLGLDTILTDYKAPEVLDHYTCGMCGVDKRGRPVWYELLGKLDMHRLAKSVSRDDLVRFKFYQLEMLRREAQESGTCQILVIVDMKDMSINALGPALEIWREYISILQDYYPYLVHEIVIINPPVIFTEFTLALRPYLNRSTRSKVTVLGANFLKHLLMRMPKHEIPAYLGGYKCDLDNNKWCTQDLNWEGKVPTWMQNTDHRLDANVYHLTIPGGQRLVKETHVATPGSHVFWEFFALNQPLVLSVYLNRIADDCCAVRDQRIEMASEASANPLAGFLSEGAGRILVVLDNCKNFASVAKGLYRIGVKPPDGVVARRRKKLPLGDYFNMNKPIGAEERKWREYKFTKEPHYLWNEQLPPIV